MKRYQGIGQVKPVKYPVFSLIKDVSRAPKRDLTNPLGSLIVPDSSPE
jgi:hypothetical protein